MPFTIEQQLAIDQRNKNLLVAAAAGSGKTQVMVERITKLICDDRISIDTMLIVTFTNAAAAEMKERIHKTLLKRLEAEPEDMYIKRQLDILPRASIGTMHSFCLDVIRNHFNIVSVDPGFKMGMDSIITVIKSKLIDEIFEEKYTEGNEPFISLVDAYGGRADEKLRDLLLKVYGEIQAQPYPMTWLENKVEKYNLSFEEFLCSDFVDIMLEQLENEIDDALNVNELSLKYSSSPGGPYPYIPALENDRDLGMTFKRLIEDRCLNEINDYVSGLSFERAKAIKKADLENNIDQSLLDRTKALRDEYKKRLKDTIKLIPVLSYEKEHEKINKMYPILKALTNVILEFEQRFALEKRNRGILDFNDLEHYTLKILADENVRNSYKNKFSYIFFDEYQDSNLVQETIIESIKKEDNLFFVGDVKQAIYRFRLSEPMLFNARYTKYASNPTEKDMKIDLSKNFRSNKKILEFSNYIFKSLMSQSLGQVDYSKKEVQLEAGIDFPKTDGGVELNIIKLPKLERKDANADNDLEEENSDIEYRFIVEKIKAIVGEHIYDAKTGNFRKVDYGDIAILFRTPKNSIDRVAHYLKENDIPSFVDYSETNATSIEVLTVYDYLRIIDNRFQDEPLLGALTSFFGKIPIDDIIDIRIEYHGEKFLYNAIDRYRKEKKDEISTKLNCFFEELESFKRLEGLYELSDFIWQIVSIKGYLVYLSSLQQGNQKKHNIMSLIAKAKEYSEGESNKLFGFLIYMDKIFKDRQNRTENIVLDNENVVKLMSIHKSKGLEFPIVILCNTNKKFNEQEYREDIILHNRFGIGTKYVDTINNINSSTLMRNLIITEKKQEALSEEIRILYVAFTRAINKLIIVGATKNLDTTVKKAKKGKSTSLLKKINNYFDWILAVLWNHSSMAEVRYAFGEEVLEFELEKEPLSLDIKLITEEDVKKVREVREVLESEARKKFKEMVNGSEETFIKPLPIKVNVQRDIKNEPLKYSVTELVKSKESEKIHYRKNRIFKTPKFLQEINDLSAMEVGTLMHSVLEHLDFTKEYNSENLKLEIKNMVTMEKITEAEASYIDLDGVLGLFKTEVGQLIKSAVEVHKEETFLLHYEGKLVDGVIDCYLIDINGNITLIDYKTDREIEPKKYLKQLELYKIALESQYKTDINMVYIYWFTHKKVSKLEL